MDGHVKLAISMPEKMIKLSLAQSGEVMTEDTLFSSFENAVLALPQVTFLLNILVSGNPGSIVSNMEGVLRQESKSFGAMVREEGAFDRKPGYPKPSYRISE